MTRVVAVVPARNEADRIGATVMALRSIAGVEEVVVVDDASADDTSVAALGAGASVLRAGRHVGKGRALEGAVRRCGPADVWLFADADLAETAGALAPVVAAVVDGDADLAIADPPAQEGGGFGLVRATAARLIRAGCGFEARAALSGQRALTGRALDACRPLARGFGVETAMTIDAVRSGLRVVEVRAETRHRPTGRGLGGFAHRGRQGLDVLAAALPRLGGLR